MGASIVLLLLWSVVELVGVVNPNVEDTYSEWVFDLPLWGVITIVFIHVVWGVLLIGSAWHFIEGWVVRRRKERKSGGS